MRRLLLLALILGAVAAWFALDLGHWLSLEQLQAQREALLAWREAAPLRAAATVFVVYVLVTALSLPGATILTLGIGAVFGLLWGTVLVSFASTLGATGAFLSARYLLREPLRARYGARLAMIDAGIAREGASYLFALRLVPLFPFFLINLLLGLTAMPVRTFFWVSQVGMLAGTLVYVNAGTQLAQIHSPRDVLSPGLLGAFVLLGLFPLLARRLLAAWQTRRRYARWTRPRRYDRNLIVIGAGAAGLVSAYLGAALRAKVTLVERQRMGGDCLNTGCVPSKALIRAAKLAHELKTAETYGLREVGGRVDFARVMQRVQQAVAEVAPHDSVERYESLGVECLRGQARLVDPWTVDVDGQRLSARQIIIATGAEPAVPPIPGLREAGYLTSETLWDLRQLPAQLLVLGGGPIGCELAQAFARLGSRVTLVEQQPQLLPREDAEVAALVATRLEAEGVALHRATQVLRVETEGRRRVLVTRAADGSEQRLVADHLLVAVGRRARLQGYGLEELGLLDGPQLEVNAFQQTRLPHIYACGDVASPYPFTHVAAHTAWYAAVNSLLGPLLALRGGRFRTDYSVIPWTTFTDPQVARVGLSETEARARGIAFEVTRYPLDDLDRAIVEGRTQGFVKVLTVPGRDRILGATIVGAQAGEQIAEFVLAMRHGLGLNALLGTIHVYPTWMEAGKAVAGRWKQAHAPQGLLRLLERFHAWRRG
ncbi:MAG TPA: FAD-dependent oxidoreductase [Solimonas sp.]|nr:FAD-dependent oxidoreductase [Solimonas sp.]